MKFKSTLSFLLGCVIACGGCGMSNRHGTGIDTPPSGLEPKLRSPEYGWGFHNTSDTNLLDVGFYWFDRIGRLSAPAGNLRANTSAESNVGWDPIPVKGTLMWRVDPNGAMQQQEFEVAGVIPDIAHFTGDVWFKYLPDQTWAIVVIDKKEFLRRLKAGEHVP